MFDDYEPLWVKFVVFDQGIDDRLDFIGDAGSGIFGVFLEPDHIAPIGALDSNLAERLAAAVPGIAKAFERWCWCGGLHDFKCGFLLEPKAIYCWC